MIKSLNTYDNMTSLTTNRLKIEDIDDKEVEMKKDFLVGDGATYTGQMKLIYDTDTREKVWIKHGKGEQIWQDGAKYNGDWRNGMAEGQGTFYHANADVYTGEFFQDRANGFGVYVHSNGQRYEGYWKDDMQDG